MNDIYFNCNHYTNPVEWCKELIYEIRSYDVDVECIELIPLHENLDTEAILSEMNEEDLRTVVREILNFYK